MHVRLLPASILIKLSWRGLRRLVLSPSLSQLGDAREMLH